MTPGSSRAFAALLYLAARRGEHVPRNSLATLLFPDSDEASGLHNLRQVIYRLRHSNVPLVVTSDGVQLPASSVQDDYSSLLDGRPLATEDIEHVRGGFLPGYVPEFSEPFAEWLDDFRSSVTLRLRTHFVAEVTRSRRASEWDRVASVARACLAVDPLNEEATCALAEALALAGSKHEAVALLDSYLAELGGSHAELRVPATVLRRRIAERMPDPIYRNVEQAPLIGREREMRALEQALQRARAGELQTIFIAGEHGIGKSRLVSEFGKRAVLDGAVVTTVGLQPNDKRRPLAIFMDLIPALKGLQGALGCAPESMQLLSQLTAVAAPADTASSTPQQRTVFANAARAIADLLDAVSSESLLVIIVEDVHWADQLSLITLSDLTLGHGSGRVLMLLTSRDERVLAIAPVEIAASSLPLDSLPDEAALTLMRRLLRNTPGEADVDLLQWCIKAASGNPFFMHALATHHAVTGERFSVPPSLTDLLARRLDRLPRRVARVFDACVLLGKHATVQRLHDVLGVPALDLAESLGILEDGGYIMTEGVALRSSHFLLSDAALRRVPPATAKLLHAAVARVLQDPQQDRLNPSLLWHAAEHWAAAGQQHRAISILEERAAVAQAHSQAQLAVELLDMALELGPGKEDRTRIAYNLVEAARVAGDAPRVSIGVRSIRAADGAAGTGAVIHDDLELADYWAQRMESRKQRDFLGPLRRCVTDSGTSQSHRLVAARMLLGASLEVNDQELAHWTYALARTIDDPAGMQLHADIDIIYHTTFGNLDRSTEIARRVLALASGPPFSSLASGRPNAIRALLCAGYVEEAAGHFQIMYREASEGGHAFPAHWAAANLTEIYLARGDFASAHMWMERAESADAGLRRKSAIPLHTSNAIRLALLERRFEDAARILDRMPILQPALCVGQYGLMSRAYAIRLRQLRGEPPGSDEKLDELIRPESASAMHGLHDDVASVVWHALVERGQRDRADAYLDDYLRNRRRDRFPPTVELQEVFALQHQRG